MPDIDQGIRTMFEPDLESNIKSILFNKNERGERLAGVVYGGVVKDFKPLKNDQSYVVEKIGHSAYTIDGLKLCSIEFGNGQSISFAYDQNQLKKLKSQDDLASALAQVRLPDGSVYDRIANSKQWKDNFGTTFELNPQIVFAAFNEQYVKYTGPDQRKYIASTFGIKPIDETLFSPTNFKESFARQLRSLDLDNDGRLNELEISQGVADCKVKGNDAILVSLLKERLEELSLLHNDAKTYFNLDFNGDGEVDLNEMSISLGTQSLYSADQAEVSKFKNAVSADKLKSKYALPEVSSDDISVLAQFLDSGFDLQTTKDIKLKRRLKDCLSELVDLTKRSDYVNGSLFSFDDKNKLDRLQVYQHGIGDCYLMAPLSSILKTRPEIIMGSIRKDRPHQYVVWFQGWKDFKETFSDMSEAETLSYGGANPVGTFPGYFEKFIAKYQGLDSAKLARNVYGNKLAQDIIHGDNAKSIFELLTASNTYSHDPRELSLSKLDNYLSLVEKNNFPAIVGTDVTGIRGLTDSHYWVLLNYQRNDRNLAKGRLTIRDMNGLYEPKDKSGRPLDGRLNGIFSLPLRQFKKNFDVLEYADLRSPLAKPLIENSHPPAATME